METWLGTAGTPAFREQISPELHVTGETPPLIIFHAADDPIAPVEDSIALARACWRVGVPAALHVFPHGGHGHGFVYSAEIGPQWQQALRQWLAD